MEVLNMKIARETRDSFATMPCGFCNTKIEDEEVSLYVGERDKDPPPSKPKDDEGGGK